ncbi:cytochrome P450 [Actinomadura scrupuli]|uniref:cytochrome P450 n=1 Tax=Actinomadura scrupuli TaxID=559629 RepID=UPI003D95F5D5
MEDTVLRLEELPMADDRQEGYRILRDAGPLVRVEGGYLVTSWELGEYVFKNPEIFSSERAFDTLASPVPLVPLAFDPPEHTRYRRMLQPFFTPRTATALQASLREQVGALIDGFIEKGSCDLVTDLAVPLPAEVFLTLFGLPLADRDRLIAWNRVINDNAALTGSGEPTPEVAQAGAELFGYLGARVAAARSGTGDDVLTRLVSSAGEDPLDDTEAMGLCFIFVLAGLDTVASVLSTTFAKLAARPELRRQIVDDPSIIPDAVEEMLRVDPANSVIPRVTTQEVELCGEVIPAGSSVGVAIGAANLDPGQYDDPDTLDLRRQARNLTFGTGAHRCLGVHLARQELKVVLEEWHRRIPEYELAAGARPQVTWPAGVIGIASLPIVFPPGKRQV